MMQASIPVISNPLISAIICTLNRAGLLARALGALCGQTLGPEFFEIIVIDDGSSDDTRHVVNSFVDHLPLRYAYQANSGLASGKNHGLFLARAPIVIFIDDDDVADSRLLEQHLQTHHQFSQNEYAVLGFTDLSATVAVSPLMHYVTQIGCHLFSYPTLKNGATLDFTYFWGGRSSCKRAFLLEHGVFNPVFRFGAEDIELGYRLSKFGLRVVYDEKAVSHMVRTLNFDSFCRRCFLQGKSNKIFSRLHDDNVVQEWTHAPHAERQWENIKESYDLILKTARDLDRYANARANAGLPIDELALTLLHNSYKQAFDASRIKGTVERAP